MVTRAFTATTDAEIKRHEFPPVYCLLYLHFIFSVSYRATSTADFHDCRQVFHARVLPREQFDRVHTVVVRVGELLLW